MTPFPRFLAVVLALAALAPAVPVEAGVPQVVFGEDFTATW